MKVFKITSAIVVALLMVGDSAAINLSHSPNNNQNVQVKSQSRTQLVIEANNQLISEITSKLHAAQQAHAKGDDAGAALAADSMGEVVDKVQERWLGSIDKEDPEIADEFYHKMRDAIREIHATEGFVNVKVAKARDGEADWLTKIVKGNAEMQALIPATPKAEDRVAVADS